MLVKLSNLCQSWYWDWRDFGQIVEKVPAPTGDVEAPSSSLDFWLCIWCLSWGDSSGSCGQWNGPKPGDRSNSWAMVRPQCKGFRIFTPKQLDVISLRLRRWLYCGLYQDRCGYCVGDTVTLTANPTSNYTYMVQQMNGFAGLYPKIRSNKYNDLREALEKLRMMQSSNLNRKLSSPLGFGFRYWFLGTFIWTLSRALGTWVQ